MRVSTQNKFPYWLYTIFFMLGIYEHWINGLYGSVTRYYYLFFLVYTLFKIKSIKLDSTLNSLIVWIFLSCLSLLWSDNIDEAFISLNTMIMMTGIIILISQDSFRFDGESLMRLIDTIFYISASLVTLGLFFSETISDFNETRYILYLFGLYIDPNNLLVFYFISFTIGVYNLYYALRKKILSLFFSVASLYLILMTGSRSGIVGLFLVFVIFLWGKRNVISLPQKVGIALFAIFLIIGIYSFAEYILPDAVFNRLFGKGGIEFTDSTGRTEMWTYGINRFLDEGPILGLGFGTGTSHSTFVTVLVSTGIIVYPIFLYFIISVLLKLIKQNNVLALLLFSIPIMQAFFIDALNKRFFWNAFVLAILLSHCTDRTFIIKNGNLKLS